MFKSKLKRELIEEYVKICHIEKLTLSCKNLLGNTENFASMRAKNLKRRYELIFLRFGLIDLSFAILKKQINENFYDKNQKEISKEVLEDFLAQLVMFEDAIENKMKQLGLSEFEIKFIINFC